MIIGMLAPTMTIVGITTVGMAIVVIRIDVMVVTVIATGGMITVGMMIVTIAVTGVGGLIAQEAVGTMMMMEIMMVITMGRRHPALTMPSYTVGGEEG